MLKNIKISTQFAFILLLMLVILGLAVGNGLYNARTSKQDISELHDIGVEKNTYLQFAFAETLRARLHWAVSFLEMQSGETAKARISLNMGNEQFEKAKEHIGKFKEIPIKELNSIEQEFLKDFATYYQVLDRQHNSLEENSATKYIEVNLLARKIASEVDQNLANYNQQVKNHVNDIMQQANKRAQRAFIGGFILLGVLFLLLILCWINIQLRFIKPLKEAVEHFKLIENGDLRSEILVKSNNEIGQLFSALKIMQSKQRTVIGAILQCSTKLACATGELNTITTNSGLSLQQQHQELELAASAVNEMTVAVEEVAHNAVTTSEASKESNKLAQDSRTQIHATLTEVKQMSSEIQDSSAQVQDLAVRANNIGAVLDVIRTVSEQTNLLALNAAIEAARAGEAGRGFAVVADEVRTLARRTQDSTSEIEKIVTSIQESTEQAVNAMLSSSGRAQTTLETATIAGEALEKIFTAITQINERNLIIASAAEEQAQVAREVDRNLVNIRDLSSAATAGANKSSNAISELNKLAEELNSYTKQFSL